MRLDAPPISDLRLTQIHRWAMLWLQWFAAFLENAAAFAPLSKQVRTIAHRWLNSVERLILSIVIVRAAKRFRPSIRHGGFAQYRRKGSALRRAIIGAKMRRALRSRDLTQRIAALRQSIDTLIARFAARIPRGLTRRRPIRARRERAALYIVSAPRISEPCFDTS